MKTLSILAALTAAMVATTAQASESLAGYTIGDACVVSDFTEQEKTFYGRKPNGDYDWDSKIKANILSLETETGGYKLRVTCSIQDQTVNSITLSTTDYNKGLTLIEKGVSKMGRKKDDTYSSYLKPSKILGNKYDGSNFVNDTWFFDNDLKFYTTKRTKIEYGTYKQTYILSAGFTVEKGGEDFLFLKGLGNKTGAEKNDEALDNLFN